MNKEQMEGAAEAILFTLGRAVSADELAKALEMETEDARNFMSGFMEMWNGADHGTEIIALEDGWQMRTREEFYPQLIALEKNQPKPNLSDVLLETLSIIAYRQPVTRAEIERIRGVNSDHAVSRLVEYHLVKELGRASQPGRPILFGTTEDFLRAFDVSSKDALPEIPASKEELFREEAEEEAEEETEEETEEKTPEEIEEKEKAD